MQAQEEKNIFKKAVRFLRVGADLSPLLAHAVDTRAEVDIVILDG